MPKTIGILGGMGTFATLHFLHYLTDFAEPDEFRFILDNAVHIPERGAAIGDVKKEKAVEQGMINSFLDLGKAGVDFVVVPCNQAHYWHKRLCDMFSFPWLNMLEITAKAAKAKGAVCPLILGGRLTIKKELYSEYIPVTAYLPKKENEQIYQAIVAIKKYKALRFNARAVIERIIAVHENDCDSVILACTELPIALNLPAWKGEHVIGNLPLIDSSLELAKATIKYARGE